MPKYTYPEEQLPTPKNSKLLALVGESKKVLEVGCALGFQTRSLTEIQHCAVTGVEIDPEAAEHARQYCERLLVGNIEIIDLKSALDDEQFDVITFADVLEHLRDPASVLRKVRPFLRPGGYLVASIPNIAHSSVIYELARGRFKYRSLGLLDETHIHFFTRQSIYDTFEAAGYQIDTLARNSVAASDTEFKTSPETEEDRQFIEYIKQRNPEAETYQFVVKAISTEDSVARQSALVAAQDQARLAALDADLQKKRANKVESELRWVTNQWSYKLLARLRRFAGR